MDMLPPIYFPTKDINRFFRYVTYGGKVECEREWMRRLRKIGKG
jgi:hypothetical protein